MIRQAAPLSLPSLHSHRSLFALLAAHSFICMRSYLSLLAAHAAAALVHCCSVILITALALHALPCWASPTHVFPEPCICMEIQMWSGS